jgi:hypothetical protein
MARRQRRRPAGSAPLRLISCADNVHYVKYDRRRHWPSINVRTICGRRLRLRLRRYGVDVPAMLFQLLLLFQLHEWDIHIE